MSKCMICGRPIQGEGLCSVCSRGYLMGEDQPLQEGCRYCNGTKVYEQGGRVYDCQYCS